MRFAVVTAAFVGAFVLACTLLKNLLPAQELPRPMQEKLSYLAAHGNDYNALFLGSSRMEGGIIPTLFDRTVAEHGFKLKSFNAGIAGMATPQDAYLLDRILEAKLKGIRWVFLELQYLQTGLPQANQGTLEEAYWHDWPRFALVGQRLLRVKKSKHWRDRMREGMEQLSLLSGHASLFAKHCLNFGRGSLLLHNWIAHESTPLPDWKRLGQDDYDGWIPGTDWLAGNARGMASLEADLEKRRRVPPVKEEEPVTQQALDLMIAKIQGIGATPILIVPPNAAHWTYFYPRADRAQQFIILNFCDPRAYPELFEIKNRTDTSHLNAAGAHIFTSLVAESFLEAIQRRGDSLGVQ